MINTFEAVKAMNVAKIADLSAKWHPASLTSFHIFVVPLDGATVTYGETLIVNAKCAKGASAVDVPVQVGDWSPILFESLSAEAIDLTKYDVYYTEMANY